MDSRQTFIAVIALACAAALSVAARFEPLVIHNASPSAPIGFYARVERSPGLGDLVTLSPPRAARDYAAMRNFGDDTDRFLKRVAAIAGQRVCAEGGIVRIDGWVAAHRAASDSAGAALPSWEGCVDLRSGEVFLLGDTDDSFDGRYWGVTRLDEIDGVWRHLSEPETP